MKNKQIIFAVYGVNFVSEVIDLATARCALAILKNLSIYDAQIVDVTATCLLQQAVGIVRTARTIEVENSGSSKLQSVIDSLVATLQ